MARRKKRAPKKAARRPASVKRREKKKANSRSKAVLARKTYDRRLTTRAGRDIVAHRTELRFRQASYTRKKVSKATRDEQLSRLFDSHLAPRMREFFDRQRKVKRGNKFIFRVTTQHNLKGKRIKGGFSARRTKIKTKEGLEKFISRYKAEFFKKMEKYLHRKDMSSISFSGISMEVVKDGKKEKVSQGQAQETRRKR